MAPTAVPRQATERGYPVPADACKPTHTRETNKMTPLPQSDGSWLRTKPFSFLLQVGAVKRQLEIGLRDPS